MLLIVLASTMGVKAQGCYRGFVDVGPSIGETGVSLDITTAHGYQFNKNWFLGGGTGLINIIETYDDYSGSVYNGEWLSIPLFLKVRFDMLSEKSWTFFAEENIGPSFDIEGEGISFYSSTVLGIRKRIKERMGINLGFGCSIIPCVYEGYEGYGLTATVKFNIKIGMDF